ncbi:hypothetical protein STEG23_032432, partial [Scotinomys teguina]
ISVYGISGSQHYSALHLVPKGCEQKPPSSPVNTTLEVRADLAVIGKQLVIVCPQHSGADARSPWRPYPPVASRRSNSDCLLVTKQDFALLDSCKNASEWGGVRFSKLKQFWGAANMVGPGYEGAVAAALKE